MKALAPLVTHRPEGSPSRLARRRCTGRRSQKPETGLGMIGLPLRCFAGREHDQFGPFQVQPLRLDGVEDPILPGIAQRPVQRRQRHTSQQHRPVQAGSEASSVVVPHGARSGCPCTTFTRILIGRPKIYPNSPGNPKKPFANPFRRDSSPCMIRADFLDFEARIDLGRDGSVAHRLARRANALVLLDDGMSCGEVAKVLLLDDDTVRSWYRLYEGEGIEGLASFGYDGSACRLSDVQRDKLRAWIAETLPRTTREVGGWIETECRIAYESRSGLIALLALSIDAHRDQRRLPKRLDALVLSPVRSPVMRWPTPDAVDAAQLLDVDMDQFAGLFPFVADRSWSWIKRR